MLARRESERWHQEVPGARWFRSDLHIHTLDDHPSSNFKYPQGMSGSPSDSDTLTQYARAFLKAAISKRVEVIGLSPHAVKAGETDETSAAWRIVEVWDSGTDDDGIPFRDKVYAVFPGFEPNLSDGGEGLHLLFLFDADIGRESYISTFNAVMGAIPPWSGGSLRISQHTAATVFGILEQIHERLNPAWDYLCIAPHAFGNRGLFCLKSQVLEGFPHECLCALELKDGWLPDDAYKDKDWLKEGLKQHHHALIHSSDAYSVDDIGRRHCVLKLAEPRIEAVRQAFLAADSRLRIAYCGGEDGQLVERSDLPDACPGNRPWLRAVTVKGGSSFFAGRDKTSGAVLEQTFQLNPDLNCLIGGRMSGKSTFLDGIRAWFGHDLPKDESISTDVRDRAYKRFLLGDPEVTVDIRGPHNPTAPAKERWPALFYSQRELQKAVRDQATRRYVLYRLISQETAGLLERDRSVREMDSGLGQLVDEVETSFTAMEEAEQDFKRVEASKAALARFKEAGIETLIAAQADRSRIQSMTEVNATAGGLVKDVETKLVGLSDSGVVDASVKEALDGSIGEESFSALVQNTTTILADLQTVFGRIQDRLKRAEDQGADCVAQKRAQVLDAVIRQGGSAEELNQFDALTKSASDHEKAQLGYETSKTVYRNAFRSFARMHLDRARAIAKQRTTMQGVAEIVKERFGGDIRIETERDGITSDLEAWILGCRESGVTRWWNSNKERNAPFISPDVIRHAHNMRELDSIGMSPQVAMTFGELMTRERRMRLAAVRNDDRYRIQLRVGRGPDNYRDIDQLSGGAQVSVLLSLVLETDDVTPLIVDQPEDEIDKAYLFDVLLPALRRLKGRRQVIFATHDANIVVNGDADNVLFLTADHEQGRIALQGAIEGSKVKSAILDTLDGGRDAFELRLAKYGF